MLSLVGVWVGAVGPLVLRLLTRCSSTAIGKLSFMICLCKRIFLDMCFLNNRPVLDVFICSSSIAELNIIGMDFRFWIHGCNRARGKFVSKLDL